MSFIEIKTMDLLKLLKAFWKTEPLLTLTKEQILTLLPVEKMFLGVDDEILVARKDHKRPQKEYENEISLLEVKNDHTSSINDTIVDPIWVEPTAVDLDLDLEHPDGDTHDESDYSLSDIETDFLLPTPSYEHLYKKLDNGIFECTKCSKSASDVRYIVSHSQLHLERCCLCSFCGKVYKDPTALRTHEILRHLEKKTYVAREKSCSYCGMSSFRSNIHFFDHINVHTKENPYHCSCGSKLRSQTSYLTHVRKYGCSRKGATLPQYQISLTRRPRERPPAKPIKKKVRKSPIEYVCNDCGSKYKTPSGLKRHRDFKHLERTVPCPEPQCKLLFSTQRILQSHLKVHYELSKCEICSKKMATAKLNTHMRLQHSNEQFPCDECQYVAKSKWALVMHKRTSRHARGISVTCVLCSQEFKSRMKHFRNPVHKNAEQNWLLKYHISSFSCQICKNCSFSTVTDIVKHLTKLHKLGNLACMEYLKSLQKSNQL